MKELDYYRWSGHAVLMGNQKLRGQTVDEVLAYYGNRIGVARRDYRRFVMDGILQGRRDELVGGGLRRSLELSGLEMIQDYDERVLGNGEFIEQLRKEKGISDRLPAVLSLKELIVRIARAFEINPEDLRHRNRRREIVEIRSIISYFATREMGHNGAELGRALNISRSAVSIAADRGEEAVEKNPKLRKLIENN
jgi:hypothetical protein